MLDNHSPRLAVTKVPALSVCNSSVLALFASGRTRGIALEVGAGVTHAVPVFEGFALNHAVLRFEGAGQDITHRLKVLLGKKGHHLAVRNFLNPRCIKIASLRSKRSRLGLSEGKTTSNELLHLLTWTLDICCRF